MGYKLNGSHLSLDVAFRDSEGTQYPASWLRSSTAEQRAAVPTGGITWEVDPPWYDQRFYWGTDRPKPIANLKKDWIQIQKDTANSKLARTDWLIIRKAESDTAIPTDITTYRTAVRTKCKEREDQITACSDTDALAKLITDPSEFPGTADNGATEKKDSEGNSYDPKQYNFVANSNALKDWPTES